MIPFPLFLAAAASLCIISVSFGISWGMQMAAVKFTKEVRDEALHNFEEKFYNKFVENYDKEVKTQALALFEEAMAKVEELEREENNDESTGSN